MAASGIASAWNSFSPDEVVLDGDVRLGSGCGGFCAGDVFVHVEWSVVAPFDEASLMARGWAS